jgi:hypothetical protein
LPAWWAEYRAQQLLCERGACGTACKLAATRTCRLCLVVVAEQTWVALDHVALPACAAHEAGCIIGVAKVHSGVALRLSNEQKVSKICHEFQWKIQRRYPWLQARWPVLMNNTNRSQAMASREEVVTTASAVIR